MSVGRPRNGNRYLNPPKDHNTTSANDVRQMARRSPIAAPVPAIPTANRPTRHRFSLFVQESLAWTICVAAP